MRAHAVPQLARFRRAARLLVLVLLSLLVALRPATAQSILRDSETEAFFDDISRPLISAAGLDPRNVKILLIQDSSINAFVAGGQIVYIHSGLVTSADNSNQIQGVIAHELGHVAGGHIIRLNEGASAASRISILSLLLGAAAMAVGGGEAGMAVMAAGQQAAMGKFLAFTRTQEASADAAGLSYLNKAGISGRGSIEFFNKLRKEEFRLSSSYADVDPYAQTHPLSSDRAATLEADYRKSPAWDRKTDPAVEARFLRIKAKLVGFAEEPAVTMRLYPESDQSVPAHYARAYAWHRSAYPDKANAEVERLIATSPHDPYFLELQGQILLESGKPREALPPLREAVARAPDQPMIAAMLGHALIATEDRKNFDEARRVLRQSVARDRENPFAWYQLGIVYDREGDVARAALATAERYNLVGESKLALVSAESAMRGIPQGTADYLRAQDIAMVSRSEVERDKKKR